MPRVVSLTTTPMRNPPKSSGEPSELRATVALAIPVVVVQLGFMAMGVVDTLIVGRLSARALAAVALGNLYFFNVSILGQGTLMALDPLVAQALGAGDDEGVAHAVQRGVVLAVALSVVTALLLAPATSVLTALRQPHDVVPDAAAYTQVSIIGVLPYLVFVVLRQTLQAMHRVAPIVWTIVIANVANGLLDWALVYGHAGSPPLGVVGSAIATAASRWLMFLLLLALTWRELRPSLSPMRGAVLSIAPLARMLRIGLPIGLQQALEAGAFGAIGLLMGLFGTVAIAAHQIAITLAALTFMVPLGVGSATAVRVGHAVGAGDQPRAKEAIRAGYVCGIGFMVLTGLVFLLLPRPLAAAFSPDQRVIALAATLLPIAGVFQVFDGAQAVGAGILRGAGDTTAPLVVMLTAYWLVGVPVSAYLAFRTPIGARGLWWGFTISLSAVALFLFLRIRSIFAHGVERVAA